MIPVEESGPGRDRDPALRERGRDAVQAKAWARARLHLPQAEGADRRGLPASDRRVHGLQPDAEHFDRNPVIRAQTLEEALAVLRRASEAGLVHSVSNNQQGVIYICNCCTCSCGILRGLAELGIANAVARSAFVARVAEDDCVGCDLCLDRCQFEALSLDGVVHIDAGRCVGCGVCALACPEGALAIGAPRRGRRAGAAAGQSRMAPAAGEGSRVGPRGRALRIPSGTATTIRTHRPLQTRPMADSSGCRCHPACLFPG